jgi:hypothetical protein
MGRQTDGIAALARDPPQIAGVNKDDGVAAERRLLKDERHRGEGASTQ